MSSIPNSNFTKDQKKGVLAHTSASKLMGVTPAAAMSFGRPAGGLAAYIFSKKSSLSCHSSEDSLLADACRKFDNGVLAEFQPDLRILTRKGTLPTKVCAVSEQLMRLILSCTCRLLPRTVSGDPSCCQWTNVHHLYSFLLTQSTMSLAQQADFGIHCKHSVVYTACRDWFAQQAEFG